MFAIVVAGLILGLVALVVAAWKRQERIVFQPPTPPGLPPDGCDSLSYVAEDGQKLIGFVVGDAATARGVMMAFHGNAVEAHTLLPWARQAFERTGWAVFLPEYRGYAGLDGTPDYPGSKLDARAAYSVALSLSAGRPGQIILFGHSIGSAIAAELAVETKPASLILQSPLTSARDMARIIIARPMLGLWKLISRVHYDSESLVRSLDVPVWVAHGQRDMITPISMGRRVHAAALRKGELLTVRSAAHNDVDERGGTEYWNWLRRATAANPEQ